MLLQIKCILLNVCSLPSWATSRLFIVSLFPPDTIYHLKPFGVSTYHDNEQVKKRLSENGYKLVETSSGKSFLRNVFQ